MYQAGLILEGGGMKGMYTAGVLDLFLDRGIEFSNIYGVSAGACLMCSYLSKQRGRGADVMADYLDNRKYCSVESLIATGDLFNVQTAYYLIPEYLNPYDYEAFDKYEGKAYAVVTDIVSGRAEYLRLKDMKKDIEAVRASASLPLVSRNVRIDGRLYLDGGIADPVPIQKSILDGNRKNVVILTKEEGYVRKPSGQLPLIRARYLKYPKVYELMAKRHTEYNAMLKYLESQQENGQAFVIRPRAASKVKRIEKDTDKLWELYREGYRDAKECFELLQNYLET